MQTTIALGVFIVLLIVSFVVGLVQFALALASTGYETAVVVALGLILVIPSILLSGAIGKFNSGYCTLAYLQFTAPPPSAMKPYGYPKLG